ncbi:MAG TPA: NEW3 domain-containing protein [Burkholderiaceae bacterium]|nr:NEW3 domain-containing protein [Burkholderiaceae bacterium]
MLARLRRATVEGCAPARRVLSGGAWLFAAAATLSSAAAVAAVPAQIEGQLEVLVEDHATFSRTRHVLKTDRGRFELRFARGNAPNLAHGTRVRARGRLEGQLLALDDSGASSLTVTAAAPLSNTTGEQKVAVLLVNFQDDASQPHTVAQAQDVVLNQAGGFMRENSFQATWLTGSVSGWLTLPIARTCATSAIADAAKQAAAAAGISLAGVTRFLYVFPRNDSCGWSGVGTVGGMPSDAWINGRLELKVVAHELGHNFGLQHSHSNDCDLTPLGNTCTPYEYGDVADAMGTNTASHYNAFQKERLGWLNNGAQPPIATATASGSYVIGAFETATGNAKALKVPRGIDPATGAKTWYYIEYRQPIGFDAGLASLYQSNIVNGVLIRTAIDGDRNSSYLLDMTPNTVPTFDMTDAALLPGQAFVDSAAGVTVTLTARDAVQATVQVTLGAPSGCVRANPTVTVAAGAAAVAAGTAVAYATSVTNNDNAGCGASALNLQSTLPAGWSGSFASPTLALMPGAAASTTLTVTSPASTVAGSYPVGVKAISGSSPAHSGSASSSYAVAGALTTSVATNSAVYRRNDMVTMTASVRSGGAPVANAGVVFTIVKPNGATVAYNAVSNASGVASASYRVARKDPLGAWQVHNNASFQGSSANAASAFAVQ